MYFNSDIRPVDCNINSTSTCISIQTFDQSTAILIQQVHVFQFGHSTSYLLQCLSLHCYALLLLVQPCPDVIQLAHNFGTKLLIYLVGVTAEASHIGGTVPVRELFIDEHFLVTVCFMFYFHLLLNRNEITSVAHFV